jgi:predicted Zn finger-like uncharacterized protein
MIITCPSCDKKYLVEEKALTGEKRQVRCGECGTLWQQDPATPVLLDPQTVGITEANQGPPPNTNPALNKMEKTLAEEKPRGLKGFINNYYLDWIVILFALGIVLFVTYRERGTIFEQAPSFKKIINPRIGGNPGTFHPGLIVQGINYSVAHQGNVPHLVVSGELVNVSAQTIPVPPLTITVSGKHHRQDPMPKSHSWQHINVDDRLLPGGRSPFRSTTTHPGWSNIDKVDVSY